MIKLFNWFFFVCFAGLVVSALMLATLPQGDSWRMPAALVAIGSVAGMALFVIACVATAILLDVLDAIRDRKAEGAAK